MPSSNNSVTRIKPKNKHSKDRSLASKWPSTGKCFYQEHTIKSIEVINIAAVCARSRKALPKTDQCTRRRRAIIPRSTGCMRDRKEENSQELRSLPFQSRRLANRAVFSHRRLHAKVALFKKYWRLLKVLYLTPCNHANDNSTEMHHFTCVSFSVGSSSLLYQPWKLCLL